MIDLCVECYFDRINSAPHDGADITGAVDFRFQIDAAGSVTRGAFESSFSNGALPSCVLGAIGTTRFVPGIVEAGRYAWVIEKIL